MTAVVGGRVLTPAGWVGDANVYMHDGLITSVGPGRAGDDRLLVPGFVDLQVNGIDDVSVATATGSAWGRLDELLLAQGVTAWCPTLTTMPKEQYAAALGRIGDARRRRATGQPRPYIAGAHLEGPFLGAATGAHPRRHVVPLDLPWLRPLLDDVAVITIGAEQAGAVEAIEELADRGILVALGHTEASESQFDSAVAAGARMVTHVFNAMSGVHHRAPGVAAFALTDPAVSASLIADGVHVHPRVLRLAFQALGAERAVLVTDAVAWRDPGSAVRLCDGAARLPDGTLAGSAVTMDGAVRQCVAAGVDMGAALVAASRNPSRLLQLGDRGAIEPGRRADLVALTPSLEIEQVWVAGIPVR